MNNDSLIIEQLKLQNSYLITALEYYSDENNYKKIEEDLGHRARFALENAKKIDIELEKYEKIYDSYENDIASRLDQLTEITEEFKKKLEDNDEIR